MDELPVIPLAGRVRSVLLVLWLLSLVMACPAGADDPGRAAAFMTPVQLNVTNGTVPDPSSLSEYRITPEPVRVQAGISETMLPAAKGEMASGPRNIGITLDPAVVFVAVITLAVLAGCVLYFRKRERGPDEQE